MTDKPIWEVMYGRIGSDNSVTLECYTCHADSAEDALSQWRNDTAGIRVTLFGVGRERVNYPDELDD